MMRRRCDDLAKRLEELAERLREERPTAVDINRWRLGHEARMIETGLNEIAKERARKRSI